MSLPDRPCTRAIVTTMRIVLRDTQRRLLGRTQLDTEQRPTRVHVDRTNREVMLDWESATDDAGHLRKCIVCGCPEIFREKAFPQVTVLVIVLAFAGAAIGIVGQTRIPPWVLVTMAAVLVVDVAILMLARQRLVCYRCRSRFRDLPIARYHRSWDRATAERYPSEQPRDRENAIEAGNLSEPLTSEPQR